MRPLLFVPACVALAACAGTGSNDPGGTGGHTDGAGGTTTGSGGASPGTGGSPDGAGGARAGGSGGSTTTIGTGGRNGSGGNITTATGGASGGGTGGAAGSASGGSPEDDGADCTIAALPDSGALPTIAKLPDPFKKLDGTRMTTNAEWRCRREEIRKQAEKYAYGEKPAKPATVSGTVTTSSVSVTVTDRGQTVSLTAPVVMPGGSRSGPIPAIIVLAGGGFGAPLDNAVLTSEGIALVNYDPYAVGRETGARTPKQGAFYTLYGSNSSTGLLVAWSWGISRIIDVIEKSGGTVLNPGAIAVTGCSRFGKGAFAAGVFDQRVALTMPIESGSAGVPIWRGIPGEGAQSLPSAFGEQPWLGDAFGTFTGRPTALPVDTHELVAMIAPRGLLIMDNPFIANLGPRSAHVAALAGAEVYKALGVGANISYHSDVQSGTHCSLRPEWSAPLRSNIRKFLTRTGNDPGAIRASASATGRPTDWIDWTTPALN